MATEVKYRITAVDNTKAAVHSVTNGMKGLAKTVFSLRNQLTAALGVGGFGLMITKAIKSADEIQKLSIRLGATTEALSELRHVADLTGVPFKTMTMGFQRMTRRIAEAAEGMGEARGALKELGLSAKTLAQMKPEDQFTTLADAMANVASDSDKVRLSMKLFDSEGVALVQTMKGGSKAINAMREEAVALGLSLSQDQADGAAAAADGMTRLKTAVTGLTTTLAIKFGPAIATVAEWLADRIPIAAKYAILAFRQIEVAALNVALTIAEQMNKPTSALNKFWRAMQEFATGDVYSDTLMGSTVSTAALEAAILRLTGSIEVQRGAIEEFLVKQRAIRDAAKNAVAGIGEEIGYLERMRLMIRGLMSDYGELLEVKGLVYTSPEVEQMAEDMTAGLETTKEKALELGGGMLAMGEMIQQASALAGESMGWFIDSTVSAMMGGKRAYAELGKMALKWSADTLKSLAATAAAKAIFYKAEAYALASNPMTAALAPMAAAAAGVYASLAAKTAVLAVGLGMASAANAPSGSYMSQSEREASTGLGDDYSGGYGSERTISRGALTAANVNVTHIYNGTVNFGSQDLATASGLQRVIDSGELYFEGSQ